MALIVKDLFFSYENKPLLRDLSFRLKKGEISSLIGASGSGKSTLFKILTGLIAHQGGKIFVEGSHEVNNYQKIAYMMQQDLLLPWRHVLDNMTLAAELGACPYPIQSAIQEALNLLEEVGLKDCAHLYPEELSGGMRQRVSLARALLQRRPILLLDEPFGALDVGLREQIYQLLRRIREKNQTTMLMVTHDFRDALSLSDRILLLAKGKIYKEWEITPSLRQDFHAMGLIQQEIKHLLIQFS